MYMNFFFSLQKVIIHKYIYIYIYTHIYIYILSALYTCPSSASIEQYIYRIYSNIEQVLAVTPYKAPTIRPPASHHENYTN